jgi:transposase-like protein
MSANEEKQKKPRRPRREFSAEFKAEAVKLVLEEGKPIPQGARDLDLTESALRLWVEQTKTDRGGAQIEPASAQDPGVRHSSSQVAAGVALTD